MVSSTESSQMREQTDRRNHTRFTPKNGTMAINNHALGPVVNISMGGLSFRYMDDPNNPPISDTFGIFLASDDILIDKIHSRMISDELVPPSSSFMQTRTRQRSICFLNLTSEQQEELRNFLLTKTQGIAQAD